MPDAFLQWLLSGDLVGMLMSTFTVELGDLWYGLLLLILATPLYIRYQSLSAVGILWILCSGFLIAFLPLEAHSIVGLLLVLGISGMILLLFARLRG